MKRTPTNNKRMPGGQEKVNRQMPMVSRVSFNADCKGL